MCAGMLSLSLGSTAIKGFSAAAGAGGARPSEWEEGRRSRAAASRQVLGVLSGGAHPRRSRACSTGGAQPVSIDMANGVDSERLNYSLVKRLQHTEDLT